MNKICLYIGTLFLLVILTGNALAKPLLDEWFDSFGVVSLDEERAHITNLAIYLQKNSELIVYMAYCGETPRALKIKESRSLRDKRFLTSKYKISKKRIVMVNGGVCGISMTILQPMEKGSTPPNFFEKDAVGNVVDSQTY